MKTKKSCAQFATQKTNVDVTDPVVVGVDPLGLDIRAPFGIVRVPTENTICNHRRRTRLRFTVTHTVDLGGLVRRESFIAKFFVGQWLGGGTVDHR